MDNLHILSLPIFIFGFSACSFRLFKTESLIIHMARCVSYSYSGFSAEITVRIIPINSVD